MLENRVNHIREEIAAACHACGRSPDEITLVGVTKHASQEDIREAVACGIGHIGENRVQDAVQKFEGLQVQGPLQKHLIGHLQSNKVKPALECFDLIQSVDSVKLVDIIDREAATLGRVIPVFIQINVSGEEGKFGIKPYEVNLLTEEILMLDYVRLEGIMTIAPYQADETVLRYCFSSLRDFFERLQRQYQNEDKINLKHLSMGMTDDYKTAIEEGSTMVRIGRAIFSDSPGWRGR